MDTSVPHEAENIRTIVEDWSGRGSHVDFGPDEAVPLTQGRFLGQGVMGPVYETHYRGVALAWKRRFYRQKIGKAERKEIEILKKLRHHHIITLVGTYTHHQFLGLLLYPVAVCDLHTFFEDYEAYYVPQSLEPMQKARLLRLGFDSLWDPNIRTYLLSKIGCLARAIEYLYSQRIRHKDLKPSNILLSRNNMWLTDFGSATDFSLLSASETENGERGTPKYFAPEVAAYEPSGRAADVFSLGCIFLEMVTLTEFQSLQRLKDLRPAYDRSYQANLDQADAWCRLFDKRSFYGRHLICEIESMLSKDPQKRPTAAEVRICLEHIANIRPDTEISAKNPLFEKCCASSLCRAERLDQVTKLHEAEIRRLQGESQHWAKAYHALWQKNPKFAG